MSEQVKSLTKALSVIEYLGQFPNGAQLQDIARDTGINKTSIHRMLSTFEHSGYVVQPEPGKSYRLTMKLMNIGHSAIKSDVIGDIKPILELLLQSTNETINFVSREGDQIVFLDKLEPTSAAFRTRTFVGMHSSMYCSASGKCFLAFASQQEQEGYWQRNASTMRQLTVNTVLDKDAFFAELNRIKQRGYALDDEENEAGISCVAVPVFDTSGAPVYSVSVSSLTPRLKAVGYGDMAQRIKKHTLQIESKLFKH